MNKRAQAPRSSRNGCVATAPTACPEKTLSTSGTPQAMPIRSAARRGGVECALVQEPEPLLEIAEGSAVRDQELVELA
jgi:hypothetical protein